MATSFDLCIRGGGIVGRTLALLAARERLRVALVTPAPTAALTTPAARPDVRAYALNAASRQLLEGLRCWPDEAYATAVMRMQVHGDQGGAVHFDAATQGVPALAWIVDVPALETRLTEAVRFQPLVEVVHAPVEAPLTVVCEGRASSTRSEFGVPFDVTPYAQTAIATRLDCELPHGQVARQWFLPDGVLAFLPLSGPQSHQVAVVWSVNQASAPALLEMEPEAFTQRLQETSQGSLGALSLSSERVAWPLQQAQAQRWCGPMPQGPAGHHWVLAGDAAHNVHPLAGQGLNLGLADVQTLARLLQERDYWRSVGDMKLLRRYERERKAQMWPMGLATDSLQQLFARTATPLQTLRNWGMNNVERSGPLKHWLARQAMGF